MKVTQIALDNEGQLFALCADGNVRLLLPCGPRGEPPEWHSLPRVPDTLVGGTAMDHEHYILLNGAPLGGYEYATCCDAVDAVVAGLLALTDGKAGGER